MATAEFFLIYIDRKSGVSYEELEKKMNISSELHCIPENLWILYTTSDEDKWYKSVITARWRGQVAFLYANWTSPNGKGGWQTIFGSGFDEKIEVDK